MFALLLSDSWLSFFYAEQGIGSNSEFFVDEAYAVETGLFSSQQPLTHRCLVHSENVCKFLLAQIILFHYVFDYLGIYHN